MILLLPIFSTLLCTSVAYAAALQKRSPEPFTDFTKNEFFKPAADAQLWGTLYARSLQLADGSLLMTWENYPAEPPLVNHPIFRSVDGGATWSNYSAVYDQKNGWGMRFQPFLYTLPQDFGGFAAGTILAAGVSAPASLSGGVYIELYASVDQAKTFNFVSHIAYGDGPEDITNGHKALWEPFLLMYNGSLVCYYSDQRDPNHGQQLVHTTTEDLITWSTIVPDVVDSNYEGRPGMSTVAHIETRDEWILTYEACGTNNCRVSYKISDSPLTFGSVAGVPLQASDGTQPTSGPYVIWLPNPNNADGSGMIIISSTSSANLFIGSDNPEPNLWLNYNIDHWSAYSRSLRVVELQGKTKILVGNGGNFGPKENNGVANAIIEIPNV